MTHPAVEFFLNLKDNKDYWNKLVGSIEILPNIQAILDRITKDTTLEELNGITLELLEINEFKTYLNAKIKRQARKNLAHNAGLSTTGSASIIRFTLNNANVVGKVFLQLFGITIAPWILLTLAVIAIVGNGPFNAAVLKLISRQFLDMLARIMPLFFSQTLSKANKFFSIGAWIALELMVYAFGCLSAMGDYKQAEGIAPFSYFTTLVISALNGIISFYGFKKPFVDLIDTINNPQTNKKLSQKEIEILLIKTLGISCIAFAGISPPAFLAQQYENGSEFFMGVTLGATAGASLLFSYDLVVKDSIQWPKERGKRIAVSIVSFAYLFTGINMLGALMMLLENNITFPTFVMLALAVITFFAAGYYNGIASVPITNEMYDDSQVAFGKNEQVGLQKIQEIFVAENTPALDASIQKLNQLIPAPTPEKSLKDCLLPCFGNGYVRLA